MYSYGFACFARLLYTLIVFIWKRIKNKKRSKRKNLIFFLRVVHLIVKLKDNQTYLSLKYNLKPQKESINEALYEIFSKNNIKFMNQKKILDDIKCYQFFRENYDFIKKLYDEINQNNWNFSKKA